MILTVQVPAQGSSIRSRANDVTDRLRFILGDPTLKPSDVRVVPLGATAAAIYVRSRLLVTLTPEDATYNRSGALKLAQV
jgi:hypothetical protein